MANQDCVGQLIERLKADNGGVLRGGNGGGHAEVFLARAPGRIDVMGGMSEYAGGLACLMPTQAAAAVMLQRRDDRKLVLKNYNSGPDGGTVELSLDDFWGTAGFLPVETLRGMFTGSRAWAAYLAGAYPVLGKHKKLTRRAHGANVAVYSDVPAGMGAQAALACAGLWALTGAYHLILDPMEIAVLAQRVANQIAGTLTGVVDAATATVGRKGQLLALLCRPHDIKEFVDLPPGLMVAGMQFEEPEAASLYRDARVATFMAQGMIARFFADMGTKKDPLRGCLANVTTEAFEWYFGKMLPAQMTGAEYLAKFGPIADRLTAVEPGKTYALRGGAAFHVGEQARAESLVTRFKAMREVGAEERRKQAQAVGMLMVESHTARTQELGIHSATADALVEMVRQRGAERGLYGARLAGGDGGAVTVLAEADAAGELKAIAQYCREKTGRSVIVLTGSSNGTAETQPQRLAVTEVGGSE